MHHNDAGLHKVGLTVFRYMFISNDFNYSWNRMARKGSGNVTNAVLKLFLNQLLKLFNVVRQKTLFKYETNLPFSYNGDAFD